MSVDTKIYLNPHATVEDILKVMHYVSHVPFEYKTFKADAEKKSIHFEKAPSLINPFTIKSQQKLEIQNHINISPSMFLYQFIDIANIQHFFYLHTEISDDPFILQDGFKLLTGKSHLFNLVIGKKMIDFFGGKMIYFDSLSYEDSTNLYTKPGVFKNRLHLVKKLQKEQENIPLHKIMDMYFYDFYAKLYSFSKISTLDILNTQEQFKIPQLSSDELLLFKMIDSIEKKEKLEKSLTKKPQDYTTVKI
jgi:hypothetical protein